MFKLIFRTLEQHLKVVRSVNEKVALFPPPPKCKILKPFNTECDCYENLHTNEPMTNIFGLHVKYEPCKSTSHERQFYDLTSGFTRLIMKTKYVCHVLISLNVTHKERNTQIRAAS